MRKVKKIVICDIDGTIADTSLRVKERDEHIKKQGSKKNAFHVFNRGIGKEPVKEDVKAVVVALHKMGYQIVYLSGRDDSFINKTERWLKMNDFPDGMLFMRKNGDYRKDSIVKKELYEKMVLQVGHNDVLLCIDDRDQVVELWRKELNLTCLQVDYGNF